MTSYTTRMNLEKPNRGTQNWDTIINANMDIVDSAFSETYRHTGTFNGTAGVTVTLSRTADSTSDYTVYVTPTTRTASIGDIEVEKTTTNFVVKSHDNNTSDTFEAAVVFVNDFSYLASNVYEKWYVSRSADITNHASLTNSGSFASIVAAIGSDAAIISFPGNKTYVIDSSIDTTASSNDIYLHFQPGAKLKPASGATLTVYSPEHIIASPRQQIVDVTNNSIDPLAFTVATGKRSPGWLGADGTGDESTELEAIANSVSGGVILLPFSTFTVAASSSDYVECNGAIIEGQNTTVVGYLGNYVDKINLKLNNDDGENNPTADFAVHPVIIRDASIKMLRRVGTNKYAIVAQSSKGRYVQASLENNITTTTNSLASTSSDATAFRVTELISPVEVVCGYTTKSGSSGTWSNSDLVEIEPTYDGGLEYVYQRCTGSGDYAEYTVTVPSDGFFSVSFVRRSDTSDDVDILVDGSLVEEALDTTTAGSDDIYTLNYYTTPGSRVIKIINQTAGTDAVRVVGINFAKLKDQRNDVSIDTHGVYVNDASVYDALNATSENDIAIFDHDAGKWGNGYHGGESSISTTFYCDGTSTSLSNGEEAICQDLEIVQSYTIDWSGSGGGSLDVTSEYISSFGGYYYKWSVVGDMNARSFYTTLFGVNENFDELMLPKYYDISALSDGNYVLPKSNYIEYRQSTSKQRFSITHTQFASDGNNYGGPFLYKDSGTYHKYYNAIVANGYKNVTELAGINFIQVD